MLWAMVISKSRRPGRSTGDRIPSEGQRLSGRTIILRFRSPEDVALAVDCVDQADGVAVVHLLAELPDADGDRVRITLVVVPDALLHILAREHPSLVAGERLQERILPRRERNLPAGATHAPRLGVDLQIVDPDDPRPVDRTRVIRIDDL